MEGFEWYGGVLMVCECFGGVNFCLYGKVLYVWEGFNGMGRFCSMRRFCWYGEDSVVWKCLNGMGGFWLYGRVSVA